jgi:hypothetical protein
VELKKKPLQANKSSQEYPLIREALGQLLTVKEAADDDVLAIAVPSSSKFETLAAQWRGRLLPYCCQGLIQNGDQKRKSHLKENKKYEIEVGQPEEAPI